MSKDIVRDEISAEVVRLLVEERKRRRISGNSLAEKAGLSQALIRQPGNEPVESDARHPASNRRCA